MPDGQCLERMKTAAIPPKCMPINGLTGHVPAHEVNLCAERWCALPELETIAAKARVFGDEEALAAVLEVDEPLLLESRTGRNSKLVIRGRLGRCVRPSQRCRR